MDPLALPDLAPLAPLFAGGRVTVVLHAGDNDLTHLKRRYRLAFGSIFDTSLAGRFLGARALGLDTLLREYLGIELPASRQKDDWSERPLTAAQEAYAAADVLHLFDLKARLVAELRRIGRLAWVEEECAALAADPPSERTPNPEAWAGLKGARLLPPRGLAVLREVHEMRERLALATDRPPFKIVSDDTLMALARNAPADVAALRELPGCSPRVVGRWGDEMLAAVGRARALPEPALPVLARTPRPPALPASVRRRIEALRAWRTEAAPRFGLEPGVLLPNWLIRAIAEAGPRNREALAAIEDLRRWRVDVLGGEILAAIGAV